MKIQWSKEALKRLIEIELYIAEDSPERAVTFVEHLIKCAEKITAFPYMGRIVPEFSHELIREVIEKSYRIVYKISKDRIDVLTVFEGHQLLNMDEQ